MPYCYKCGTKAVEGGNFCTRDGTRIIQEPPIQQQSMMKRKAEAQEIKIPSTTTITNNTTKPSYPPSSTASKVPVPQPQPTQTANVTKPTSQPTPTTNQPFPFDVDLEALATKEATKAVRASGLNPFFT